MPTPAKPYTVLEGEGKSHRTKAEMQQRKAAEKASLTGLKIREAGFVKNDPTAHEMFKRVTKLLQTVEKNDAIYENVINRYCALYSECEVLKSRTDELYRMSKEMRTEFSDLLKNEAMSAGERADLALEFGRQMVKLTASANATDKTLQSKRKMLLDIEKENIMTVAAALRSVPKKVEKPKGSSLRGILSG